MQSYKGIRGAKIGSFVYDCAHPGQMAIFYAKLVGGTVEADPYGGYEVVTDKTGITLGFQYDSEYEPPVYLGGGGEQQPMLHVDIAVKDRDQAVAYALSIGAKWPPEQFSVPGSGWEPDWTTLLDPDGHPFFLHDE